MPEKKEVIEKKGKECFNCEVEGQYKCPKCFIRYCSVDCYKLHIDNCKPIKKATKRPRIEPYSGADTVNRERLKELKFDDQIKNHLSNKYLRYELDLNVDTIKRGGAQT